MLKIAAGLASMVLLSATAAMPSRSEKLTPGFNDAVYYSIAIERPDAQFVPQPIRWFHRQSVRSRS
jgi:hypothetical protein